MKIQELQQPYRALAEMRREQSLNTEKGDFLNDAFTWVDTKEGGDFWCDLLTSNTPEIPAESLAELKEWQKEHTEYNAVLIVEQPKAELSGTLATCSKPDPRLFTVAVAAMQGMLASNRTDLKSGEVVEYAWHLAEALINEGKKRNLL